MLTFTNPPIIIEESQVKTIRKEETNGKDRVIIEEKIIIEKEPLNKKMVVYNIILTICVIFLSVAILVLV